MVDVVDLTTMVSGLNTLTVPSEVVAVVVVVVVAGAGAGAVVVVEVVDDEAACAEAMLEVTSIIPKKVKLLRLRIAFFIFILSYEPSWTAVVD